MTGGFSVDWLSLREPADHAARDVGLLRELASFLGDRPLRVVDLGCGTGSNLRAAAPHLPREQHWRLVDHDDALLARARDTLRLWADAASEDGPLLRLTRGDRAITVEFVAHDLAADPGGAFGDDPDLVTAAAFFDLVSASGIERFAEAVGGTRAVFYAALTYDGREDWTPSHADDAAIRTAFLRHMRKDKGFGPAAGDGAALLLEQAFAARGYGVRTADSAWRLGAAHADLVSALVRGQAEAVAETGDLPPARIASWLRARERSEAGVIGHVDLLARRV